MNGQLPMRIQIAGGANDANMAQLFEHPVIGKLSMCHRVGMDRVGVIKVRAFIRWLPSLFRPAACQ